MGLDNPLHIAFFAIVLLLVFGAKRLPEMGRSLGTGLRGFKESVSGEIAPPDHAEEISAPAATSAPTVALAEPVHAEPRPSERTPVRPVA